MSAEEHPPLKIIARVRSDFPEKFGIPRQSGLVPDALSRIVFEPEYRSLESLRGIEGFDYLWIIWEFSENIRDNWSPTVRPPRLGGNTRLGVFATRSPFRPNPIGLSSVRLERIEHDPENGLTLVISGADLMDGTPVYDIKPYIPYTDAHPEASGGFASVPDKKLAVMFPQELMQQIPEKKRAALTQTLAQDPRPSYRPDGDRLYGLYFAGFNIRFHVDNGVLTVCAVEKIPPQNV
ncbi:MAG: tRNA (N6-threonylcarbamoyladenosine(37)-N6)-methyltransferase TrmO [Anaerolineaceae bacterium]|nr:tRNA (N6-threonylcarbamoyladenosine(37)-N6)-methyltransferase TrmO [Anaerolineaceae bacterium]